MARIALVHDLVGGRAGGGGGVRLMLELALNLRANGHDVVVVSHDYSPSVEIEQLSQGLEVRAVRRGQAQLATGRRAQLERYWRGMRRVAALVPDDVDVVNAHDFPALRAGRLAAQRLNVPLLWTRNDDIRWERVVVPGMTSGGAGRRSRLPLHFALGLLDLRDARRAAAIVVLSKHDAAMVSRAYRRRADIIRSGPAETFFDTSVDRGAARRGLGVADGEFLVLAFALLVPYRRFEDLIEAAGQLGDVPELRVRIVGSDHLDPDYGARLTGLVRERCLDGRVVIDRRALSDGELRALYAAADLYVFPSSRQSYGLAPLEALASRTPVVVSRGAGVHEILEGRPGVCVVPPGRPDAIAAAVREAITSPDETGLERTRTWLRDHLSNRRYASAVEELIDRARDHANPRWERQSAPTG